MLNRRILRIKAFKVLYSFAENPTMSLSEAQAALELSCEATRDLYLFMLNVIPAVTKEASKRIELAKSKYCPTEEDLNPNMKFANNKIAAQLLSDPDFQKLVDKKKLSWDQFDVFIRNLYDSMKSKDYFQKYMSNPQESIKQDAELFTAMCEQEFVDNVDLEKILEDLSILWIDDLAYSLTWCCRTLEDLSKGKPFRLLPLYQSELMKKAGASDVDSDSAFVSKLLASAFSSYEKNYQRVSDAVTKFEKDRLYSTDVILIVMGLAEAKTFPEIPVKVTMNEYVEISKYYSTPKSRSFVNGILDRFIQADMASGEIVKSGKGLL